MIKNEILSKCGTNAKEIAKYIDEADYKVNGVDIAIAYNLLEEIKTGEVKDFITDSERNDFLGTYMEWFELGNWDEVMRKGFRKDYNTILELADNPISL